MRCLLAVVAAAHVLGFRLLPRRLAITTPSASRSSEVDVVVDDVSRANGPHDHKKLGAGRGHIEVPGVMERGRTTTIVPTAPTSEGGDVAPVAPSSDAREGSFLVEPNSLGLSGSNSYMLDVAKDSSTAREPESAAEVNNRAIRNVFHDPSAIAEVVHGLENVTRRLDGSPFEGRATFSIRVDDVGLIVGVTVDEASADRQAWTEVANATFNALAQRRIRIPRGSKGLDVRIEVVSQITLPSGARQGLDIGPRGATFDLSDIGAHPRRVVGAHVISEHVY